MSRFRSTAAAIICRTCSARMAVPPGLARACSAYSAPCRCSSPTSADPNSVSWIVFHSPSNSSIASTVMARAAGSGIASSARSEAVLPK